MLLLLLRLLLSLDARRVDASRAQMVLLLLMLASGWVAVRRLLVLCCAVVGRMLVQLVGCCWLVVAW